MLCAFIPPPITWNTLLKYLYYINLSRCCTIWKNSSILPEQPQKLHCVKTQKVKLKLKCTRGKKNLVWQHHRNLKGKIMEFTKREKRRNHRCRQKNKKREGLSLRFVLLRKCARAEGPHEHWVSDPHRNSWGSLKDCAYTCKNAPCMFSRMTHVHKHAKL